MSVVKGRKIIKPLNHRCWTPRQSFSTLYPSRHRIRATGTGARAICPLCFWGSFLIPERDLQFNYLGLQPLIRPVLFAFERDSVRVAPNLLHAGRDGFGPPGSGPRGTGCRILRTPLVIRLYEFYTYVFNSGTLRSQFRLAF
ncbi:MAG: hypothetical protein CM1200mP9_00670 [Gammaproteobacteria bacterium]|nr:MAG: hypothetical protein CM1200mP9_00670 [Gammaproteobacteria bacterium]